jgi:hypothetical protein
MQCPGGFARAGRKASTAGGISGNRTCHKVSCAVPRWNRRPSVDAAGHLHLYHCRWACQTHTQSKVPLTGEKWCRFVIATSCVRAHTHTCTYTKTKRSEKCTSTSPVAWHISLALNPNPNNMHSRITYVTLHVHVVHTHLFLDAQVLLCNLNSITK